MTGAEAQQKHWSTLVARCALHGYQLWRTDAADGPVRHFVAKWGMVRLLATVEDVEAFLEQAAIR